MASASAIFDILARDRASSVFKKFGNAVDGSSSKLSKLSTLAKVGLAAGFAALGTAVVGAGKVLFDMTKAAAEDQKAQALLAQTLKNSAGATDDQIASVENWISAQGRALGVTDDELRPALQRLAEATGSVSEAQKLASLAMDVSAGTGRSLKSVSEALMKAQNGQISGLSRLGIETKNAKGETLTFEQATRKMGQTFKGQAEARANTLSGKMARLKLILSETGEEIGAKLIPIATKFATWMLNEGLPAIQAFGNWMQSNLGPIFSKVGAVWRQVTGSMSGDTNKTVASIREILQDLGSIFRDAISIAQSLWRQFGDMLTAYTKSSFSNALQIIRGAFQIIAGIFKVFSSLLKGDWKGVWDGIKQILRGAWTVINGLVKQALNVLKLLLRAGWSVIKSLTKAAWDGIKQLPRLALEAIKGFFRTAITGYKVMFRAGWDALKSLTRAAWSGLTGIVKGGADRVMDAIRAIPGKIRDLAGKFKEAGSWVIQAFIKGLSQIGSTASSFASAIWNAVRGVINAGIDRLNSLLRFDVKVHGVGFTFDAPDIGHLARGTKYWRGGLAVVGEEGPELVDLPRGSRVMSNRESMGSLRSSNNGTQPIIVQLVMPGGRVIEQILIKHTRDENRPLQVRTLGATA